MQTLSRNKGWFDTVCADADVCRHSRHASDRGDTVIPEYRPDAYDLSGIRLYTEVERQPLAAWDFQFSETDLYGFMAV